MDIFGRRLTTIDALREHYHEPNALVRAKKLTELDARFRAFVELSTFCLLATSDAQGNVDVSPRGGPAGFVRVLDAQHLVLPDLSGNNLLDSVTNVLATPFVGLLLVVPGHDETVRVNGRACLTVEPDLLSRWDGELRRPKLAIGIEVVEVFHHCAKAFRRGDVWRPDAWADAAVVPDFCVTYAERFGLPADELRAVFEEEYAAQLADERTVAPTGEH